MHVAVHFPLECANSFAVLEREMNNDEEELFSARSDGEQTSTANSEKTSSAGRVFRAPQRRSGATHVAHPESQERPALSFKELHAPILDEQTWLSDVQLLTTKPPH
eukprot:2305765-Amphidinium_carterae.1